MVGAIRTVGKGSTGHKFQKKNGVQANSGVGEGGRETDTRYTEARVVKHSGQGDPASPTRHRKVLHATHRTTLVGNTYFQPWNI